MAEEQIEESEMGGKTKEQLDEEKKTAMSQRIVPLDLSGMDTAALLAKAKELHAKLFNLEGEKYDMNTKATRQQEDVQELAERVRQMNKGAQRKAEGDDELSAKFSNAPPKIAVCSKYDRQTDKRSYKERMALFNEQNQAKSAEAVEQAPQEVPPAEE